MKVLKLTEIWIYPVKSLGGIRLTSAKVMPKGLESDRRWMLVDENGTFLTQRTHPILSLFNVSIEVDEMIIKFKDEAISVQLKQDPTEIFQDVIIWDDTVKAFEVNAAHSYWFTKILGINCKLVYFPEQNSRPVDPNFSSNNEQVSLADGFPFLIIGQSSLDDLNGRLKEPLPMNRFRPNFVFSGGDPYEEDGWKNFTIGDTKFIGVKPCSRCVMTTINQTTAEKGKEPLKTLSTYRKENNKIYFGQNLLAVDRGYVSLGDNITLN